MRYWQEPLLHELTEACDRLAEMMRPTDPAMQTPWEFANQLNAAQQPDLERVDEIRRLLKEWHTTCSALNEDGS